MRYLTTCTLLVCSASLVLGYPGGDEVRQKLAALVDARRSEFAPYTDANGKTRTRCNLFVAMAAREVYGCEDFADMQANQIHDFLAGRPRDDAHWEVALRSPYDDEVLSQAFERCAKEADQGKLVVVAWKNVDGEHGHVALVHPGATVQSGKWKMKVPKIAQAGTTVFTDQSLAEGFGPDKKAALLLAVRR